MTQRDLRPVHLAVNRLIEDDHLLQPRKRLAEDLYQSSKRTRASSSFTEELSSQACDSRGSNTTLRNNMDDLKGTLVEMLYFEKIDERLTHLTPAQGTTCRWFLTKPEYLAWHNPSQRSDHGGFLWIRGNPGTGKSTLMKFIFETAKLDAKRNPAQITLSFFFLARGAIEEKTTTGLYRSLLHQLFEKAPDLRDSLDWMTIDGARTILRNEWQDEALKQTLTQAIQRLGKRSISIFVDALDECDQNQAESMIFFFEELCHRAIEAYVGLKICFSSRHYPTIVIQKGIEIILEDTTGHTDDICQFIKSRLRLGKSNQVKSLQSEILEKSSGIFLWVVLVLDILNADKSMPIRRIREHLRSIPPRLNDLFDMILDRDKDHLQELQLCLECILFAARPLKAQELYFAVQFGCERECSGYWDQDDVNLETMQIFVRTSSKGLAEVTRNKASEVQFIHESVRDYLLGKHGRKWFGIPDDLMGRGHEALTQCCVAQIRAPISQHVNIPDPLPNESMEAELRENLKLKFPFLQYAISHVFHHANTSQTNQTDQHHFLTHFPLQDWVCLKNAFVRYVGQRYTKSVTLLYILAEHDSADLISIHPGRKTCFEAEDQRYGAPALAAIVRGNWEAVWAFAKAYTEDAPPESPMHTLCGQHQQNQSPVKSAHKFISLRIEPMYHYLTLGTEAIVFAFLLSTPGLGVNVDIGHYRTPLFLAAEKGHTAVVALLLARGAYIDLLDDQGQTPLWYAAKNGHEGVMELLLEKGANIDFQDHLGWTALWHALESENHVSIRLLLQKGADVESRDLSNRTPLCYFAGSGNEAAVKLLLEAGANIESHEKNCFTALWHALRSGNEVSAELLLKNGANVESRDANGWTPLSWAAELGTGTIVRLLVRNSANIESRDTEDYTPLFLAVARGDQSVIGALLDNGADILSKNGNNNRTPLSLAVERGTIAVFELLLQKGNSGKIQLWPSLMPAAITRKHGYMSRLLLDSVPLLGWDSENGWTLLLWTALIGSDTALELLSENIPHLQSHPSDSPIDRETMIRLSIDQGADIHSQDTTDRTLFSWAVSSANSIAVIKILLERGADLEMDDEHGRTPLSWAATAVNNVAIIGLLLEKGAELESRDKEGLTPLSWAVKVLENVAVIKLLLRRGADLESKDIDGKTPLRWARSRYENRAVINLLVKSGAK